MTTEDDFRRALDANPKDWQTLAVYSDWLRDRDDPRADGYAALARHQKRPFTLHLTNRMRKGWKGDWFSWVKADVATRADRRGKAKERDPDALPPAWYNAVKDANQLPNWDAEAWACFRTPADAFDAAALGFATLPPERRTKLLAGPAKRSVAKEPVRKPTRKPARRKGKKG